MSTGSVTDLAVARRFPISLEMYHQMIDNGVLTEDDHIELIEGVIVAVRPQSPEHARVISSLQKLLRVLGDDWVVRTQLPLTLARSEPEPDVSVCRQLDEDAAFRHPTTAALVVEVARDSLALDRAKAALYAEAGVVEYWIVDLEHTVVEVFREPGLQGYGSHRIEDSSATLLPAAVPGVSIAVAQLFRARH